MPSQVQRSAGKLRAVERQRKRQASFEVFQQGDLLGVGLNQDQEFLPAAVLKKSTGAVHMKNTVSGLQRKVYNVLLEHAYEELPNPEIKLHKIPLQDLMVMVGFDSKNTGHLKTAVKGLMTNLIEWNYTKEEGTEDWEASTALAGVRFRDGVCYYEFSEILRQRMYHPGRFAKLDLMEMRELSSATAVALYENTTRFVNVGRTPWWPVETWRAVLGNTAPTYDEFKRLKEKALIPALSQIHGHTRLELTPEYQKLGRKVTHMRFLVGREALSLGSISTPTAAGSDADQPADAGAELSEAQRTLMDDFCLSVDQIRKLTADHGEDKLKDVAAYTRRRYLAGEIKTSVPGYFLVTLSKFDTATKTSALVEAKSQAEQEAQERARAARDESLDKAEFTNIYRGLSYQVLESMSPSEQAQLYGEFETHLNAENPAMAATWRDPARRSEMVCQALLRSYIARRYLPEKDDAMAGWISVGKDPKAFAAWLRVQAAEMEEKPLESAPQP